MKPILDSIEVFQEYRATDGTKNLTFKILATDMPGPGIILGMEKNEGKFQFFDLYGDAVVTKVGDHNNYPNYSLKLKCTPINEVHWLFLDPINHVFYIDKTIYIKTNYIAKLNLAMDEDGNFSVKIEKL